MEKIFIEKIDKKLLILERKANRMGYQIDNDERYIGICELISSIDMGEIELSESQKKLISFELEKLFRCFYSDYDEIKTILR